MSLAEVLSGKKRVRGDCGRAAAPTFVRRKCLCGDSECYKLMEGWFDIDPSRAGYFYLTAEQKDPSTDKKKAKQHRRQNVLTHLGTAAKGLAAAPTFARKGQSDTQACWGRIHLHPLVHELCVRDANGLRLPDRVPDDVAKRVNDAGFSFTARDKMLAGGGYEPSPNYSLVAAREELEQRQRASFSSSSSSSSSPPSPFASAAR